MSKLLIQIEFNQTLDIVEMYIRALDPEFYEVFPKLDFYASNGVHITSAFLPAISGVTCFLPNNSDGRKPVGGLNKCSYNTSQSAKDHALRFTNAFHELATQYGLPYNEGLSGQIITRRTSKIFTAPSESEKAHSDELLSRTRELSIPGQESLPVGEVPSGPGVA